MFVFVQETYMSIIVYLTAGQVPREPVKLRWNPQKNESRLDKVRSMEVPHKLNVSTLFQVN
jgi:hypothetical protein